MTESLVAWLPTLVAGGIALYVRSVVSPLVARLEDHSRRHTSCESHIESLFKNIRELAERLARLEGAHTQNHPGPDKKAP